MLNTIHMYLKSANYIVMLVLMGVVAVVAFSMGSCGKDDKYDKFLNEYEQFKKNSQITVKYGDSLRTEVDKLKDSVVLKDVAINKLNNTVTKATSERKKLTNKLSQLESEVDSLKESGDSSAIIIKQDSVIVNLKDQLKVADNIITKKDSIIQVINEKYELSEAQKKLFKSEADSLRIVISKPPVPPKKDKFLGFIPKPNRYVVGAISFGAGVIVGSAVTK